MSKEAETIDTQSEVIRLQVRYQRAMRAEMASIIAERDTQQNLCRKAIKERDEARSERDRVNARIRSECADQVRRLTNELAERTRERDLAQADRDALRYACESNGVGVACVSADGEGVTRRVVANAVDPLREWRDRDGWRGVVQRWRHVPNYIMLQLGGPVECDPITHALSPAQARGIAAALNQCADLAEK